MAEVNDLLNWGMVDDYNCESEHSAMGKEAATEADMPLPHKAEVPAPPVDTSLTSKCGGGGGFPGE